jgi:glycosyltransferase involved in cell wall biosynthesis
MYRFYEYNRGEVIYSIVTPVYNQESIIVKNVKSILDNTVGNFELILILDYCFDRTEQNLLEYFDTLKGTERVANLICVKIFKNASKPLFETKCDNIGFRNSSGKYCLEIQADMEMTEFGYNLQLTKPFTLFDNVMAVSGRCAHNLFSNLGVGKLGTDIEKPIDELSVRKSTFYVFDSCVRGPLLLDREKLKEMNYLDEEEYFLDNSDHDLMARAYLEKKYVCGYVPIDFKAPLQDGSTRNSKDSTRIEYTVNKLEKDALIEKCSAKLGLSKFVKIWPIRQPIVYNMI